jgi:SET domain-containing protein
LKEKLAAVLEVRPSKIYGRGCFTLVPLKRRRKFAAYEGELLRGRRRIMARVRAQEEAGDIKVIQLNEDVAIDGAVGGNATAFINHSCAPNAFMRVVPGDKLVFFALRDIAPGEEITINYRDPYHPAAGVCRCQAPNCRSNRRPRKS